MPNQINTSFNIEASCSCGANTFSFTHAPIAHFVCHCQMCQQYTGKAFSDVVVFLKQDVTDLNIAQSTFKRFKLPPNIRRGVCNVCAKPSIEFGILDQLVFVPKANLKDVSQIPPESMHIFYHRRQQDVADDLPKYNGFVLSQTVASKLIIQGVAKRVLGG